MCSSSYGMRHGQKYSIVITNTPGVVMPSRVAMAGVSRQSSSQNSCINSRCNIACRHSKVSCKNACRQLEYMHTRIQSMDSKTFSLCILRTQCLYF